jgi:hypothetical protein
LQPLAFRAWRSRWLGGCDCSQGSIAVRLPHFYAYGNCCLFVPIFCTHNWSLFKIWAEKLPEKPPSHFSHKVLPGVFCAAKPQDSAKHFLKKQSWHGP